MRYFKYSIADYQTATKHLTWSEHGIYRAMLDQYYSSELPIPLNYAVAMRSLCVRTKIDQKIYQDLLAEFFVKTRNGYIHKRCDLELSKIYDKSASARASAEARWAARKNANASKAHSKRNADDMLPNNPITQEPINPLPINSKKPTSTPLLDDFKIFWERYPKKVGKAAALKAWGKTKPDITKVLKTLAWQINCDQWKEKNGQFVPYPATWINQGRWDDEPVEKRNFLDNDDQTMVIEHGQ
jgi:uncharacterized protein YdaU (DUF1376 family)